MTVDETKRALKNVIATHKGKFTPTGDIRIDMMAEDCLSVIEGLESQIDIMMNPCNTCKHDAKYDIKLGDEYPCNECKHSMISKYEVIA